jgi:hypothetical protein
MAEGTSQPCPSCGIAVMIGYVKCPKCHAPMPASATGARGRRTSMAGGTTSQRIDALPAEGGGGGGILWIIGVLLVGAGLAIWATQCRASKRKAAPNAAVVDETAAERGAPPELAPPEQGGFPSVAAGDPDPSFAADALEGELAGERLYATVSVRGDVLDVRSAFCDEARLGDVIDRHAAELRGAGVTRVRCSETYGTQVFERRL